MQMAMDDDDIPTNTTTTIQITIHSIPKVVHNATLEMTTSEEETDDELPFAFHRNDKIRYFPNTVISNNVCRDDDNNNDVVDSNRTKNFQRSSSSCTRVVETLDCNLFSSRQDIMSHIFYISTFAILGTVSRWYIGRFFGLDCCIRDELLEVDDSHIDFLTPLSQRTCITSNGKTQRGGAIFIDLPTNMIGSFLFGLFSNEHLPFGWLHPDHPLQQDTALHVGLKIGLCGSLTTFSSWNTQMIEMMDGTDTIYGPQVGSAIFGYFIGIACAISSCICGSHFVQCLRQWHPLPQSSESENFIAANVPEKRLIITNRHITRAVVIVLLCAGLFGSFIVADVRYDSKLYRELWLASLMAPFGALIRWRLRTLNARPACAKRTPWFPWGTFTANFVASIISILVAALKTYIVEPRDISSNWLLPVLVAVNIGFTGSLSTASSLAHELVVLETLYQSYCYAFATIICSMLVSVMIYVPIARFG